LALLALLLFNAPAGVTIAALPQFHGLVDRSNAVGYSLPPFMEASF
jgi:hypothetical protein